VFDLLSTFATGWQISPLLNGRQPPGGENTRRDAQLQKAIKRNAQVNGLHIEI